MFVASLKSEEDREEIIQSQPWSFDNNAILLLKATSSVSPSSLVFDSISVWIRIYDLPMGCVTENMSKKIFGCFGDVLEVDFGSDFYFCGVYLRRRVKIPVDKPLRRGIRLGIPFNQDPSWFPVAYERIPNFCYQCGYIDHVIRDCKLHPPSISVANFPYSDVIRASPSSQQHLRHVGPVSPHQSSPARSLVTVVGGSSGSSGSPLRPGDDDDQHNPNRRFSSQMDPTVQTRPQQRSNLMMTRGNTGLPRSTPGEGLNISQPYPGDSGGISNCVAAEDNMEMETEWELGKDASTHCPNVSTTQIDHSTLPLITHSPAASIPSYPNVHPRVAVLAGGKGKHVEGDGDRLAGGDGERLVGGDGDRLAGGDGDRLAGGDHLSRKLEATTAVGLGVSSSRFKQSLEGASLAQPWHGLKLPKRGIIRKKSKSRLTLLKCMPSISASSSASTLKFDNATSAMRFGNGISAMNLLTSMDRGKSIINMEHCPNDVISKGRRLFESDFGRSNLSSIDKIRHASANISRPAAEVLNTIAVTASHEHSVSAMENFISVGSGLNGNSSALSAVSIGCNSAGDGPNDVHTEGQFVYSAFSNSATFSVESVGNGQSVVSLINRPNEGNPEGLDGGSVRVVPCMLPEVELNNNYSDDVGDPSEVQAEGSPDTIPRMAITLATRENLSEAILDNSKDNSIDDYAVAIDEMLVYESDNSISAPLLDTQGRRALC